MFTLSDLVTDITQNAAESGAGAVELEINENEREFRFVVKDNGRGMDRDELKQALDPFAGHGEKHPRRKVGLGIPLLIQTALQSGGGWELKSRKNTGTTVMAWFDLAYVDTPPAGDIPGLFRTIFLFAGPKELWVRRNRHMGEREFHYEVRKSELAGVLGEMEDAGSQILLDRYLRSMEEEVQPEKTEPLP
jgi:hypothetical protein